MKPRLPLRIAIFGLALAFAAGLAAPAHAVRVVTWNILNYDVSTLPARQPLLRTIVPGLNADVIAVQELLSQAAYDSLLTNVLNVVEPGQWTGSNFWSVSFDEGMAFFWKPAKVNVSFVNVVTTGGPRQVLFGRVTPVGYTALAGTFRIYSVHYKAGVPSSSTTDSTQRRNEATSLRTTLNGVPANTNFLVGGDTNIYGAWEGAYIRMTESQPDNDGRGIDVLNMPGTWNQGAYAPYHTQSPSISTGGLDDRFDLLLSSPPMNNGQGVEMVNGGYFAYGNDGLHYNDNIDGGGFNNAVGLTVASALRQASDHIPVVATVQLASRLSVASSLSFGSVLIGATAQQTLAVTDSGAAPMDGLDYSLAAPSGFTAPGGALSAAAGVTNNHNITMSTGTTGVKSGNLVITSDDPDRLIRNVALSGTVLAHAVASLDSLATVQEDSVLFGIHDLGDFSDQAVRVHNRGYTSLQAQLAVSAANITGGGGRFSIDGGFSPTQLAGVGRTWNVHFDDTGAPDDTTFNADLVFSSGDEALPGATAQPNLVLHLAATIAASTGDVRPGPAPVAFAFLPPRPNPVPGHTEFRFDLPRPVRATLEIFDLSGRRVARVVDGDLPAGHHELAWSARDDRGQRLAGGLYFARFRCPGLNGLQRLVVLP